MSVRLMPGEDLDMRLETFNCKLVAKDDGIYFKDNAGSTILVKGINTIGRGKDSTIKIDSAQKYVSRTHLQIDIADDRLLRLTDVSASGTFINMDYQIQTGSA